MGKVVTFGEIMLGLNPMGYRRFIQADTFEVDYTGAEANVAVSLAAFGEEASYVTRLPANDIGKSAVATLRKYGVDVSDIVYGGSRIGIIFTEKGAAQRPSKVIYDRAGSAIATAAPGDFDWEKIFTGADWFHFTGITAALSDNAALLCREACIAAKKMGLTVSCDLNYRKNLWSQEKAKATMSELVRYCDMVIGNEEDAEKVLGIRAADSDVTSGKLSREGYIDVARQICREYGVKKVGITLRESISASDNNWSCMFFENDQAFFSKKYLIHIVNRVGGGDSFSGGLIYGMKQNLPIQETLEFATAASCLKHSIEMDYNLVSVEQVRALMNGDGSGRVQR